MESTGKGGKERGGQGIVGGKWYAHPPLRNALISGVLTGATFGAVTTGIVPPLASILFYVIAIVLGGYYWGRDGIEELFEERKIGIQVLMLAATVGAALAGLWDEAAFLAFLYGAAEGVEECHVCTDEDLDTSTARSRPQRGEGFAGGQGRGHTRGRLECGRYLYRQARGVHSHRWDYS